MKKKIASPLKLHPIDRLTASSVLLVHSSDSKDDLHRKFVDWMNLHVRENELFGSSLSTIEHLVVHVAAATAHLPQPTSLRAACFALSAELVCDVLSRYGALLQKVFGGLIDVCYARESAHVPRTVFVASQLTELGITAPICGRLQFFLSRKSYFELYHEASSAVAKNSARTAVLEVLVARQRIILSRSIDKWTTPLKKVVFRSWRTCTHRDRIQARSAATFSDRFKLKDILQTHFYAWRVQTLQERCSSLCHRFQDTVEQVVTKETHASTRLLELEDQMEETTMVLHRLKEEKDQWSLKSSAIELNMESSVVQSTGWRSLAVDMSDLLSALSKSQTAIHTVRSAAEIGQLSDLATRVVLGWVAQTIRGIKRKDRVKCSNFGNDCKDGRLYIALLHVLSGETVAIENIDHNDLLARMAIVEGALHQLGIFVPFSLDDLSSGSSDVGFIVLFALWWHYGTHGGNISEGTLAGRFCEDVAVLRKRYEDSLSLLPQWVSNRSILHNYALYVMGARSKGKPAKVLATEEEKELQKNISLFQLKNTSLLPEALSNPSTLSENLAAFNRVSASYVGLLKRVYLHYSVFDRASKTNIKLPSFDFIGFYRLCTDCKLLMIEGSKLQPAPLRKQQAYSFYMQILQRVRVDQGQDVSSISSSEFSALLSKVASFRYGNTVAPWLSLSTFLDKDVAPFACSVQSFGFETEAFHPTVRRVLHRRRKILGSLFDAFAAGIEDDGTMSLEEFELVVESCDLALLMPLSTFHTIFHQFANNSGDSSAAVSEDMDLDVVPASKTEDKIPSGSNTEECSNSIVYGEFELVMVCVCIYLNPAPFIPLATRLASFLEELQPKAVAAIKELKLQN